MTPPLQETIPQSIKALQHLSVVWGLLALIALGLWLAAEGVQRSSDRDHEFMMRMYHECNGGLPSPFESLERRRQ